MPLNNKQKRAKEKAIEKALKKEKKDYVVMKGVVTKTYPNAMFEVKLENDSNILAYISGKIRIKDIDIILYDHVTVEVSTYDLNRGRITYRH